MGNPCTCPVCTFSRRRREIDKAPTAEAYAALLDDVTTHWLNESMDMGMDIYHRDQEIESLRTKLRALEGAAPTPGEVASGPGREEP